MLSRTLILRVRLVDNVRDSPLQPTNILHLCSFLLVYPRKPSLATKYCLCGKQKLAVLEFFVYISYALCGHFCPLETISLYLISDLGFSVIFLRFCMLRDLSYTLTPAIFFSFVKRFPVFLLLLSFSSSDVSKPLPASEDSSVSNWLVSLCLILFGSKVLFFFFVW